MAYIFGSNYDALAQQENYRNSQAMQLAEQDRAMRQRAIEQTQDNYRFATQMAARENERQQQIEDNRFRTALGLSENRRREGREDYRFDVGRKDRDEEIKENTRRFGLETGFKTRDEDFRKKSLESGEGSRQLRELVGMADKGLLPEDGDIGQLFPSLKPAQIEWAKKFAKSEADAQAKQLQDIANEATQIVRAKQATSNPAPKPAGTGLFGTGFMAKSAVTTPPLTGNAALNFLILDDALREYSGLLQWDEANQVFTPRGKQTYQFGPTSPVQAPNPVQTPTNTFSPTGTNLGVNTAPLIAPPVVPTAGTPPYAFGPSSPPANPSIARAVGTPQYNVGQVYWGMKYIGGDPQNRGSWQKAQ